MEYHRLRMGYFALAQPRLGLGMVWRNDYLSAAGNTTLSPCRRRAAKTVGGEDSPLIFAPTKRHSQRLWGHADNEQYRNAAT